MRHYTSFNEDIKIVQTHKTGEPENDPDKTPMIGALYGNNSKNLPEGSPGGAPAIEEIIRWGYAVRLDVYRTLLLAIKVLWERFYAENNTDNESGEDSGLPVDDREEMLANRFHPEVKEIYFAFQKVYQENLLGSGKLDAIEELHYGDYDERMLGNIISEILLNRLYFQSINSGLFTDFINKKEDEQLSLKKADKNKQQEYWLAKCVWVELQEELSELLMMLEASRLRNGYITREFMKIFGPAYVILKEQIIRILSLKRKVMIKDANPSWSRQDVDKTVFQLEREEEKEIEKLKYSAKIADTVDDVSPEGSIDDDALNEYKKKVKKVLKEIYFLLHPHRLMHNPDVYKLTDKQKEHLKQLWEKVMEIKEYDLKYPEGTVGHQIHSLDNLLSILDKAKKILSHAGLEINVGYIIHGETIEDRITWLNSEIELLEKDILTTKEDILLVKNNKDILEKKAALSCPSKHEQVRDEMLKRAEEYRKEALELEKQFESLFDKNLSS